MQTHDEETRKFFKHSSVHCVLCPRSPSNKLSIFKQKVGDFLYVHYMSLEKLILSTWSFIVLRNQAKGMPGDF